MIFFYQTACDVQHFGGEPERGQTLPDQASFRGKPASHILISLIYSSELDSIFIFIWNFALFVKFSNCVVFYIIITVF